jgi:acetoacetate decarboxylase
MTDTTTAIPAPQIVKNAQMLIVGYEADPDVLSAALPPGLEPHPNNRVQMNMYRVPSADQTSHLDPYSLTYLCVEIDGHDSHAHSDANGDLPVPGRFWVGYWNDSRPMREYNRALGGLPVRAGTCSWERDDDRLTSTLSVDGDPVIEAEATVGETQIDTLTGHLNYYSHKQVPDPTGSRPVVDEIVEFPIPFTSELYEADVDRISFSFPDDADSQQFAPVEPLSTPSVLYGSVTFTYPQGRTIRDYRSEGSVDQ